ncbi:MAG: UDP-N-acetylglucosamine 2-epimerase (non-hydrolyzing) [Bacteroidota bacterium]
MTLLSVVGARPNFMKVGPLHDALVSDGRATSLVVHTGQHYDQRMSDVFFRDLGLPEPAHYLGVGGGTHAEQTARVMLAFEPVLAEVAPEAVVVVGDVNSTLATALVAAKRHVPVVHVEAGLRSGDRAMPEELNRIAVDHLADRLYVTEQSGLDNLSREGIPADRIAFVGNVMIDSLRNHVDPARASGTVERMGLAGEAFALVTVHRPRNVDHPEALAAVASVLETLAQRMTVLLPLHPRTRHNLYTHGLLSRVESFARIIPPAGYLEFLALMDAATVVVTDSGGIQEETTALGVPCLTLRPTTERPSTVEIGTNQLLPVDPEAVGRAVDDVLAGRAKTGGIPPLWDGRAGERIAADLLDWLGA